MIELEQKKEIIRQILLKYSGSVSGYEKLQRELWTSSLEQLQRILAAYSVAVDVSESRERVADIQADRQRSAQEQRLLFIFRTPVRVNGKFSIAIDNQANRGIIAGWTHEDQGEQVSPAWFTKVLSEQPQLARQLAWQSADVLNPAKLRQAESNQEAEDRETFETTAKRSELYSNNEANWNVVHSTLGPGLSEYQIQQAVHSGAVRLSPATPAEIQEWRREAAEERQDFLINQATPQELALAARQESEHRRIQAHREEEQRQIAAREEMDAAVGYPPLPEFNMHGEKIDAAYLNKISNTNLQLFKNLMRKHGAANLTARLRGIR